MEILEYQLIKVLKIIAGDFSYRLDYISLLKSFLLIDEIGYIWIIRVYLLTAMVTPLLIKSREILSKKIYYIINFDYIIFSI